MVIVKLMGGLGNQMFQYAVGRRLAHVRDVSLKLDLSWFTSISEVDSYREYGLDIFSIKEDFATQREAEKLKFRRQGYVDRLMVKVLSRKPKAASSYIREKQFHFDPDILTLHENVYLDGYWQSPKYFDDIENIIRREFNVKQPQEGKNKELVELIKSCDSVSLHVRRGDYVSTSNTKKYHGTCDIDFYYHAIKKIIEAIKNPHFFLFSDEPEWLRNNLKLHHKFTIIDHNRADKSFEDLRLMSQCKHNIIANSTFSWWGAYLNKNPDKIVIAPDKWFYDPGIDTSDLMPPGWIRM